MKNTLSLLCSAILLAATGFAQSSTGDTPAQPTTAQAPAQFAPGTVIPAELSKSVDAKKLKAGDQIEAKTAADMLSDGKIVMPRNTKVLGHVTSAKAHSKDSPDSMIGIAFDRMVTKDGREVPLSASLQAVGAPLSAFNTNSPTGGAPGMASAGPVGASPGGATGGGSMGGGQRSGAPEPSSYPQSGMPTGPYGTAPHGTSSGALSASSQGVVGIKDLSLNATPQASVLSSSNKNVHLDGGTQLMLKVQ